MFGTNVAIFLHLTIIIPSLIGVTRYRHLSASYKVFVMYLVIGTVTEIFLIVWAKTMGTNLFMIHFCTAAEIILLNLFLMHWLKNARDKKVSQIVMVILTIIALLYPVIGGGLMRYNGIPRGLETIYFSVLTCYIFYDLSTQPKENDDNSFYAINGAILFWFSTNFLVFAFSNLVIDDMEKLLVMHNVKSMVMVICYMAYAAGLLMATRSRYPAN